MPGGLCTTACVALFSRQSLLTLEVENILSSVRVVRKSRPYPFLGGFFGVEGLDP